MAMLSDFYPYVMPSAPGLLESLADQVIRDICIDFCSKSIIIQRTLDPVSVVAGVPDYDFAPPDGTRVHMIMQAWFLGNQINAINADTPYLKAELFNTLFPGAATAPGTPSHLIQKNDTSFTLDMPPRETLALAITMRAALKPTRDAMEVDDLLLNDYAFEIGQGALSRLMKMPKQPFSDPITAPTCEMAYVVARNAALIRANKAFGRSGDRVEIPRL